MFDKTGKLKTDAIEILSKAVRGYISYLKGEDPMRFPLKIYPKIAKTPVIKYDIFGREIPKEQRLRYIKLVACPMSKYQYDFYRNLVDKHIKDKNITNNINSIINDNISNLETAKTLDNDVSFNKESNESGNESDESGNESDELESENENNKTKGRSKKDRSKKDRSKKDRSKKASIKETENVVAAKSFGMLKDAIFASNIVFPLKGGKIGYGGEGFSRKTKDGALREELRSVGTGGKGNKTLSYRYEEQAIFDAGTKNEAPFLSEKHLHKFSSKFATSLDFIKRSKGLVYVYSEYLSAGIIPFALMLEQNGFERYTVDREKQLLEYSPNRKGGGGKAPRICYLCGKPASDKIHKTDHKWRVAKYIMLTGSQDLSKITAGQASAVYNSPKNRYGELVKIVIGTRVSGEGINFFRIRQVHILEPWFNMGRIEQIIGRAIRNCSHADLKPEERNVEVFQYAATPFGGKSLSKKMKETETIDERNYRFSENKDFIIKQIERILKEQAIDCMLNKNANMTAIRKTSSNNILTSLGEKYTVEASHKPFSRECDYNKVCDYNCSWELREGEKIKINTDTYTMRYADGDLREIEKYIKKLFKMNTVYSTQDLIKLIRKKFPEVENIYIYKVLDDFINSVTTVIYDKYDREGFLLYKGNYYIFQPNELTYEKLPIYYREKPLLTKPADIDIASELRKDIDYDTNTNIAAKVNSNIQDVLQSEIITIEKTVLANEDFCQKVGIKSYKELIVSLVLDRLTLKSHIALLRDLLVRVLDKRKLSVYESLVYKYYKNKDVILYKHQLYSDMKNKGESKNIILGFVVSNKFYCINKSLRTWKFCDPVQKSKLETNLKLMKKRKAGNKKLPKSTIFSKLEINNKKIDFKIIDTSKQKEALTADYKISQRALVTGKKCRTYHANELIMFIEKLTGVKLTENYKKKYLCTFIELIMRHNNHVGLKSKRWFEGLTGL